jgi:hypothetical protein
VLANAARHACREKYQTIPLDNSACAFKRIRESSQAHNLARILRL